MVPFQLWELVLEVVLLITTPHPLVLLFRPFIFLIHRAQVLKKVRVLRDIVMTMTIYMVGDMEEELPRMEVVVEMATMLVGAEAPTEV